LCCRVAKVVAPKKEKLAAAEGEYSELMTGLNQKKAELAAVEANLAALNAKLKEMQVDQQVASSSLHFLPCNKLVSKPAESSTAVASSGRAAGA
jgi:peptidoglycan hydrolase CwlO-like protein